MTAKAALTILLAMPSSGERRVIDFFISQYNESDLVPKIVDRKADEEQEAPDAVLKLEDGVTVGLELTSPLPKGVWPRRERFKGLYPVYRTLDRKFLNDYKGEGMNEVWLLVRIGLTLHRETITELPLNVKIPRTRFSRVFFQCPILIEHKTTVGVLDLPDQRLVFAR